MKSIFEIFTAKELGTYWKNVNSAQDDPMLGTRFFPEQKRHGLTLSWILGYNDLPVALAPAAFDAKAPLRDRISVKKLETEMPFFREGMIINERERQEILTMSRVDDSAANPIIMRVYDDAKNLIDGALVQPERMRMSLLSSGKILIKSNTDTGQTVNYNYNYDPDGKWGLDHILTLTGTDVWDDANKDKNDPLDVLQEAISTMKEKFGVSPTRILLNSTTLNQLLKSHSIKKAINPLADTSIFKPKMELQRFISDETGLEFIVYDKMFKDEEGVDTKFFPDNTVTLLPSYTLGNTWFGTTPEEYDLMGSSDSAANVSVVNTGVAITTEKKTHPVNVQTLVSVITLPSFERMSDIYIIKTA